MPTANPRVSVTLTPSMDAVLSRLSDVSGRSKSALIAELLEQSQPVFERMAAILETAKTATEEAKSRMAANMEEAHQRLVEQAGIMGDLFEDQTADLVGELEQIGRRKPKGSAGHAEERSRPRLAGRTLRQLAAEIATDTPPVTRGSGTSVPTPKRVGKSAAKPATKRVGRKNAPI